MSEKTLSTPVQYVLHAGMETFARPYELSSKLTHHSQLWLDIEALPQENHWRLIVSAQVNGIAEDGTLCMGVSCAYEAIVVVGGMSPAEVDQALRLVAAPGVLGSVRTLLTTLSLGSGLGAVILHPLSPEQIGTLPSSPQD